MGLGNLAAGLIGGSFWLVVALVTQVSEYGETNYYISLASILSALSLVGLNLTVMTYLPKGEVRLKRQAEMFILITNTVIAIPLVVITRSFPLALMLFGTSLFGMTVAQVLGSKSYKKFPVLVVGQRALQFALSIGLYFVMGIDGIIVGYGLSAIVFSYSFIRDQIRPASSLSGSRSPDDVAGPASSGPPASPVSELKSKFGFITHAYSTSMAQVLTLYADKLFIAPAFGFATLGLYQLGFQFLMFLGVIPASLIHYLLPQESSGMDRKVVRKLGLILSVSVALILFLTLGWIIQWLFPSYVEAVVAARIMVLGIVPMTMIALINSRLLGREKSRPVIIGSGVYLASLFLLFYVLGNALGVTGLAISVVASLSLQAAVLWLVSRSSLPGPASVDQPVAA